MISIPKAPRAGRWALMFFNAAKPKVPLLVEQRAIDLIKAARSMSFTAIVDIEYPSKLGPPLGA